MIIHDIEQGTQEWHDIRVGKFTASTFRNFYGKTKIEKLYEKTAERITKMKSDSVRFSNKHMERGNELEPEARNLYELLYNTSVREVGFCELSETVGCSPDGLVGDDGMIEIKSVDNHVFFKQCLNEKISAVYQTQIQFCLYVTGRSWCDYIAYNPNFKNSLLVIRVERDESEIKEIEEKIKAFNLIIDENIKKFRGKNG